MLDLKIVDEDQYDLVPVPLPGRLIVFAGPDGLMCRRNDGTITNYPAPAEGGGGAPYITLPLVDGGANYAEYPAAPATGFAHLFVTPRGVRMMDGDGEIRPGETVREIEFDPMPYAEALGTPQAGNFMIGVVGGGLVVRDSAGVVVKVEDGSILFDPGQ